ncbi:MAG: lysine--tRNA ligase [Gemmatimonadetes bacterium]|nr:lysine--tRNA ligase [Gemmatimonadota bacterium]
MGRKSDDLSRVMKARQTKLAALEEHGIAPFAYSFDVTRHAAPSVTAFEETEAADELCDGHGPAGRWAGRLVGFRSHGRSAFADIEDHTGRVQVYLKRDVIGADAFSVLDLLDLGDWIGVEGSLFRTRMGQVTVHATGYRLLSKSLRPLPLGKVEVDGETGVTTTYSGFADRESRYRQRYADLAVNPRVRDVFRMRSRIISTARTFLDDLGFVEVETPVLQPLYGGASARPFTTRHLALDRVLYLRIADELYLKRLIVGGMDRVYEISKDFRNEGIDRFHNPEFTMLEFYQAFADYEDMMELVERLTVTLAETASGGSRVPYQGAELAFEPPFARLPFVDSLRDALGTDPMEAPLEELRSRAEALGADDIEGAGRGKLLDKLFGELVQPRLVQPTFVTDHPRELSPLAKPKRGAEHLSERFELIVAGEELANAFSEMNDPIAQRARFEDQAALRAAGDTEAQLVDEDYIRALEYGLPPTGGVGIGIDRMVMMLTDQASIRDVILFPTLREET